MQISIYERLTLLTRKTQRGIWRQYPISADGLASVLNKIPNTSGLLPRDTLGTGTHHGTPFYVVWVAPAVRRLQMQQHLYTIPVPPLVWAGCGKSYRIWALGTEDYPTGDLRLMSAPFPNCYSNGSICWGTVDGLPEATPRTLMSTLKLFLEESIFNLHVANGKSLEYPKSIIARWDDLEEYSSSRYPLEDLVPTDHTLGWLIRGEAWQ